MYFVDFPFCFIFLPAALFFTSLHSNRFSWTSLFLSSAYIRVHKILIILANKSNRNCSNVWRHYQPRQWWIFHEYWCDAINMRSGCVCVCFCCLCVYSILLVTTKQNKVRSNTDWEWMWRPNTLPLKIHK